MGHSIHFQTQGQVAWITLNRPVQHNAPDLDMAAALRETCLHVSQDSQVQVAVITGAGGYFCSPLLSPPFRDAATEIEPWRIAGPVAALEKPVIAAINGPAIGQGLELALACDIRIGSENARLAMPQASAGCLPWDGGTQRLPRVIGRARALELLLTGREVDAREALALGLIQEVVPDVELVSRAQAVADSIAAGAPIALRYTKEAALRGLDLGLQAGLRLESDLNILLQSSADRAEGVRSFQERRTPRFHGR